MSRNYRKVKAKLAQTTPKSRRHRKKVATPNKRRRLLSAYGTPTEAGIACHGSKNLALWLEFNPKRSYKRCRFCGKKGVQFSCSACGETFCMAPPTHLIMPGSNPERHFPANGLMCWHFLHGYSSKTNIRKWLYSDIPLTISVKSKTGENSIYFFIFSKIDIAIQKLNSGTKNGNIIYWLLYNIVHIDRFLEPV